MSEEFALSVSLINHTQNHRLSAPPPECRLYYSRTNSEFTIQGRRDCPWDVQGQLGDMKRATNNNQRQILLTFSPKPLRKVWSITPATIISSTLSKRWSTSLILSFALPLKRSYSYVVYANLLVFSLTHQGWLETASLGSLKPSQSKSVLSSSETLLL